MASKLSKRPPFFIAPHVRRARTRTRWLAVSLVVLVMLVATLSRLSVANAAEVVVWIRDAREDELTLDPEKAPALRALARKGTIVRGVNGLSRADILARLRNIGTEIGEAFVEGQLARDAERAALAELADVLGAPPPPSDREKEALRRLRREGADGESTPAAKDSSGDALDDDAERRESDPSRAASSPRETDPVASSRDETDRSSSQEIDGNASPPAAPRAISSAPDLVSKALRDKDARLIVIDEIGAGGAERDEEIERVHRAVLTIGAGRGTQTPDRVFIVVLLAGGDERHLLLSGHRIRAARILGEPISADDLEAGLRRFLDVAPPERGSVRWIERARLAATGRSSSRREGRR